MKLFWQLLGLSLVGISMVWVARFSPVSSSRSSSAVPSPEPTLEFQIHSLPEATVYTLWIPRQSRFLVTPAVAPGVDTLEGFAQQYQAIAVLNAGFFDPENQQSTAYVTLNGRLVADPKQNQRLTDNPNLRPYLDQIFNRSEFRRYQCQEAVHFTIARHQALVPSGCSLLDAVGGGPQLLPQLTAVQEAFIGYANEKLIRDPIGINQPNARTAVGITRDRDILWVMVAQTTKPPSKGLSLPTLAKFMQTQGVEQALNLDGGSSSSLYYMGQTFYGKLDEAGNPLKRPVKSVLLVHKNGEPFRDQK